MITGIGGLMFDTDRQTVAFGPYVSHGIGKDLLIIGRTVSGPHSTAKHVWSRADLFEIYGRGTDEHSLPFAADQILEISMGPLWCLSSEHDDLFVTVREFLLGDSTYPHIDEFRDVWERLGGMDGTEYTRKLAPALTQEIIWRNEQLATGEFGQRTYLVRPKPEPPADMRYCLGGGLIHNGPTGASGHPGYDHGITATITRPGQPVSGKKSKQAYKDIGRSSNAKKRW